MQIPDSFKDHAMTDEEFQEFLNGLPFLLRAYQLMEQDALKRGCAPMDYYLRKASIELTKEFAPLIGRSSNGRTRRFERDDAGSIPALPEAKAQVAPGPCDVPSS